MDDDKEHSTLELDSETCSDSQSWKSWKNYGHLCSSAGGGGGNQNFCCLAATSEEEED